MRSSNACNSAATGEASICRPTFEPPTIWQPLNSSGNIGYWNVPELRNRCRGTSEYSPFFRAKGRGIKPHQGTRLGGNDPNTVFGQCRGQRKLYIPSCKKNKHAVYCYVLPFRKTENCKIFS